MFQVITALSWAAVIFVVADLFLVTTFTGRHGLRLGWFRTLASWDRERKHLCLLAHSEDQKIRRVARILLKLDMVAWLMMLPALLFLLVCMALQ